MAYEGDQQENQHHDRDAEEPALGEFGRSGIVAIDDDAADGRLHDAQPDGADAERGDDGIDTDIADQHAVEQADKARKRHRQDEGRNRPDHWLQPEREDGPAGDGGRHRQVGQAAGHKHESHADDDDADNGHRGQDVEQIACGEEGGADE